MFQKMAVAKGELGIHAASVDTEAWQPDRLHELHASRPDKAVTLKAAHEAAALRRVLDERVGQADASGTIWPRAEDVFAELDAAHAG